MLFNNAQWIHDIDMVSANLPELDTLAGKNILITGAAGLICSAVVDVLFRYNDTHSIPVQIYAAGRWKSEMEARFQDLVNRSDFHFVTYDATRFDNALNCPADYIIHGASNAHPALIAKEPVETMMSNFLGMKYLLDYARDCSTSCVLYISSSEVYGNKPGDQPYKENEYGYIDLLNARNSYSVGKRAAETLCASYSDEYHVKCVIARPGHIYGPTANPNDSRVSSSWAFQAARGEKISMKSDGAQIRSYCYVLDCASALLKILIKGEKTQAYNISNPNSIINIRRLAEILAVAGNVGLEYVPVSEDEKKTFNPMSNSSLESYNLLNLGWKGQFCAEEGLMHTVKIIKEVYGGKQ